MAGSSNFLLRATGSFFDRLILPHNVTGFIMLLAAWFTVSRPASIITEWISIRTDGRLNGFGMAFILLLFGLYLLLRRPRPNAFWYAVGSFPVLLYAAFVMDFSFTHPNTGAVGTAFALGFWLYGITTAIWLDRAEDRILQQLKERAGV